jgi:hypothetical protein
MNKCLTVLLNTLIWDQHAKPGGIFCLFLCIAGGMIYKQAPMRGLEKSVPGISAEDDEFKADISNDVPTTDQTTNKDEEMAALVSNSDGAIQRRA